MADALKILEDRVVGKASLDNETLSNTLDYLRKFSKIDSEKAKKLMEELMKKFGLARLTAIQIVDLMPKTADELKVILGMEKREFKDQDVDAILELLKEVSS